MTQPPIFFVIPASPHGQKSVFHARWVDDNGRSGSLLAGPGRKTVGPVSAFDSDAFSTMDAGQEPEDREMGMTERRSVSIMSITGGPILIYLSWRDQNTRQCLGNGADDDDYPQEVERTCQTGRTLGRPFGPPSSGLLHRPVSVSRRFVASTCSDSSH